MRDKWNIFYVTTFFLGICYIWFYSAPFLEKLSFHHFYGHWPGEHQYSYYTRNAFNERKWNSPGYNMSTCRFPHFPVPFNLVKVPKAIQATVQMKIHIFRDPTHTSLTLEWLWNHILHTPLTSIKNPKQKYLKDLGLEIIRVHSFAELEHDKRNVQNLFVISNGKFLTSLFAQFAKRRIPVVPMGLIVMSEEDCNPSRVDLNSYMTNLVNGTFPKTAFQASPVPSDYSFRYAFSIFGDCDFVDDGRVKLWPLGPDMNILAALDAQSLNPPTPINLRSYDLSLVASLRNVKINRVQTILAYEEICPNSNLKCFRKTHSYTLFDLMGSFGDLVGKAHEFQKYANEHLPHGDYFRSIADAKLVLCPSGFHPESGRIMESIIVGSIPVVEYWAEEGQAPNYESSKCLLGDNMAFYLDNAAPVFWVKDWKTDLPKIVRFLQNKTHLQNMQDRGKKWYSNLLIHLRTLWVTQANIYMNIQDQRRT